MNPSRVRAAHPLPFGLRCRRFVLWRQCYSASAIALMRSHQCGRNGRVGYTYACHLRVSVMRIRGSRYVQ